MTPDKYKQSHTQNKTKQNKLPGINDHMNDNPRLKVSIYTCTM